MLTAAPRDVGAKRQDPDVVIFVDRDGSWDFKIIVRKMDGVEPTAGGPPKVVVAQTTGPDTAFEITPDGNGLAGLGKGLGLAIGTHFGERQASAANPNTTTLADRDGKLVFAGRRDRQLRYDIASKLIEARVCANPNGTLATRQDLPRDIGTESLGQGEGLPVGWVDAHADRQFTGVGDALDSVAACGPEGPIAIEGEIAESRVSG